MNRSMTSRRESPRLLQTFVCFFLLRSTIMSNPGTFMSEVYDRARDAPGFWLCERTQPDSEDRST